MKTRTAYISIIVSSGQFRNLKLDMNNFSTANKVRNLRAGHITTFDIKESDGFVVPKGDTLIEDTLTIYPANVALLQIKIVESESLEPDQSL